MLQALQGAAQRLAESSQTHKKPYNNKKQDQSQVLAPFPTPCPSRLASPSVESSSVQGDVGVGVKLALLLHVAFTFLWEIVTWEKMQHQGRCTHPVLVQPCHLAIPKTMLQRGAS